MSVDNPSATGPFCAALGCRSDADVIVEHPDHGKRPVCDGHGDGFRVIRGVEVTSRE